MFVTRLDDRGSCLLIAVLTFCCGLGLSRCVFAQAAGPKPTAYEQWLDEQALAARTSAERVREALGHLDGVVGENDLALRMLGELGALGDPDSRLKQIEVRRRAFVDAQASDADRMGLDQLIAGEYARAVLTFERSYEADPTRGLPALFKGIAEIELGRWQAALDSFKAAEQDDDCLPTATLIRAWAERCAESPPKDDAEAGLRLFEALGDLPPMDFGMEELITLKAIYNESNALYWAQGAAYNLRHQRVKALLDEARTTDDPRRALSIEVAFGANGSMQDRLERLAERFPDDAQTARHLALLRYEAMPDEQLRESWPAMQRMVGKALADEPQNGFYELMRVLPIQDYKEIEHADGMIDWIDIGEPLSAAEIQALARVLEADDFEHPGDRVASDAWALRSQVMGPYAISLDLGMKGVKLGWLRSIARRYTNTFEQMVERGQQQHAIALGERLAAVAYKTVPSSAADVILPVLVAMSCEDLVSHVWIEHGQATGDRVLIRKALERVIPNRRRQGLASSMVTAKTLSVMLPISRMGRSIDALLLDDMRDPTSPAFAAYRVGLERSERWPADKLLAELQGAIDQPDGWWQLDKVILKLADLDEPRARPALVQFQADEDLYTAELAAWALRELGADNQ